MNETGARERRAALRRTTRLRPAKLLSEGGRFLCDCAIVDRSADGVRVRPFAQADLPDEFFLFDEVEAEKTRVRRVWTDETHIGLALLCPAEPVSDVDRRRVAGPYYAVAG